MPISLFNAYLRRGSEGLMDAAYAALLSPEHEPLDDLIDQAREDEAVPDDFRYGLEGLQAYRDYYDERLKDLTPEQRDLVERYDNEWTEELLRRAHKQIYGGPILPSPDMELPPEPEPD